MAGRGREIDWKTASETTLRTMKTLRIVLFLILTAGFLRAQSSPSAFALSPGAGSGAAESDPRNLLVNPNFESGTERWEVADFENHGEMAIDTKELFNGKPTLRIENTQGGFTFVRQTVTAKPNTRYRFTGHVRTKNVAPVNGGKPGALLMVGMTNFASRAIERTKSWTKVSFDFTTNDKADITVGPSLGWYDKSSFVTGTAWFSELELVEVGRNARR